MEFLFQRTRERVFSSSNSNNQTTTKQQQQLQQTKPSKQQQRQQQHPQLLVNVGLFPSRLVSLSQTNTHTHTHTHTHELTLSISTMMEICSCVYISGDSSYTIGYPCYWHLDHHTQYRNSYNTCTVNVANGWAHGLCVVSLGLLSRHYTIPGRSYIDPSILYTKIHLLIKTGQCVTHWSDRSFTFCTIGLW